MRLPGYFATTFALLVALAWIPLSSHSEVIPEKVRLPELDRSSLLKIDPFRTTMQEVRQLLEEPTDMVKYHKGEIWRYDYGPFYERTYIDTYIEGMSSGEIVRNDAAITSTAIFVWFDDSGVVQGTIERPHIDFGIGEIDIRVEDETIYEDGYFAR